MHTVRDDRLRHSAGTNFPTPTTSQALGVAALAAQKRHISVYLHGLYADPELTDWFVEAYNQSGKRLNMGKSCVRFPRAEAAALDLIGEVVARITPATTDRPTRSRPRLAEICHYAERSR